MGCELNDGLFYISKVMFDAGKAVVVAKIRAVRVRESPTPVGGCKSTALSSVTAPTGTPKFARHHAHFCHRAFEYQNSLLTKRHYRKVFREILEVL